MASMNDFLDKSVISKLQSSGHKYSLSFIVYLPNDIFNLFISLFIL